MITWLAPIWGSHLWFWVSQVTWGYFVFIYAFSLCFLFYFGDVSPFFPHFPKFPTVLKCVAAASHCLPFPSVFLSTCLPSLFLVARLSFPPEWEFECSLVLLVGCCLLPPVFGPFLPVILETWTLVYHHSLTKPHWNFCLSPESALWDLHRLCAW